MKKLILLSILTLPLFSFAQWTQIGNDIDGNSSVDFSGFSVDLSDNGNIIAVGSPRLTSGSGFVTVYENISDNWVQLGNIIESVGVGFGLGSDVKLNSNGNIVAIGGDNFVRVFEKNSGVWNQIGDELEGENSGDQFGSNISINNQGNILAVGSRDNDGNGNQSGSVRVFENITGAWTQIGNDIDGEFTGNQFGFSVSLNGTGNILAIGGPNNAENGLNTGHVKIFENISGTWTQIGDDIFGEALGDFSGESVCFNDQGNIVAIASPRNQTIAPTNGAVRVYENISGNWTKIGDDILGESQGDFAGRSLSINSLGNIVALGGGNNSNSGTIRVYKNISGVWTKVGDDIIGESISDAAGNFTNTLSLNSDGNILAVGAPNNDGTASASGHARVFTESTILNINENSFNTQLLIIPNPSKNLSIINLGQNYQEISLKIFNEIGKEVLLKKYFNIDQIKLNTQNFNNGLYLIKLEFKDRETTLKLIVDN